MFKRYLAWRNDRHAICCAPHPPVGLWEPPAYDYDDGPDPAKIDIEFRGLPGKRSRRLGNLSSAEELSDYFDVARRRRSTGAEQAAANSRDLFGPAYGLSDAAFDDTLGSVMDDFRHEFKTRASEPGAPDEDSLDDEVIIYDRDAFDEFLEVVEQRRAGSRTVQPGEERSVDPRTGGEKGVKLARYALIPVGPLQKLAEHYGRGAKKYSPRQYEAGYDWSKSYDAAQRHLNAWWGGEEFDQDPSMPGAEHLAAAAWHIFTLMEFSQTFREGDDRSPPRSAIPEICLEDDPATIKEQS